MNLTSIQVLSPYGSKEDRMYSGTMLVLLSFAGACCFAFGVTAKTRLREGILMITGSAILALALSHHFEAVPDRYTLFAYSGIFGILLCVTARWNGIVPRTRERSGRESSR